MHPLEKPGFTHVYHQYTLRSRKRDEIQKRLRDNNISSVVYYPVPLHLQEAIRYLGYKKGDFPAAEEAAEMVLSLPIYPELEETAIRQIADIINNV
jgi:dTDP-4-amino-4,6-dideoxygalactose transaminase